MVDTFPSFSKSRVKMEDVAVDASKDDSQVGIYSISGNGELAAASAETDQDIKPRDMSNNANATDVDYESHFSLRIPISSVRFRGNMLRVIDTDHDQIILKQQIRSNEDDDGDNHATAGNRNNHILVKRVAPNTYAQRSLRIAYTLITIIFVGFLFVFCCQVFLFIFIALPTNTDTIWSIPGINIVEALLSIPVLLYGLTSLMTMGCAFVVDAYRGGALFRSTAVEIIYMM